jgi:hypothetical protein
MRQSLRYWVFAALCMGCAGGDNDDLPHTSFVPEVVHTFRPPPGGFVTPIDLAVSGRGVWTLELQDAKVHVFPGGEYGASFARRGGGPGELAQPSALGIAGDTLWVLNGGNARIEFYSTDGGWLASQPLPREAGAVFHMVRAGGSFYATSLTGADLVVGLSGDPAAGAAVVTRRFGRELVAEAERIAPATGPEVYRLAVVAERLWVLHTSLPLVGIYSLGGELQRIVRYPVHAGSGERAKLPDGSPAPPPPVGAVAAWHVRPGTVYLLTQQQSADGLQRIVVASEQGELLGVTEAPRPLRFAFGAVDGDRIHAFALDSDTEETSMFTLRIPPSRSVDAP